MMIIIAIITNIKKIIATIIKTKKTNILVNMACKEPTIHHFIFSS